MEKSESIKELATALSKAQSVIIAAIKDSNNPFFKSSYADLKSVWEVARKPLTENGLCVIQVPEIEEGAMVLKTILAHTSGEYIISKYKVNPMKQVSGSGWQASEDPQSIGSAITYARRYSLSAMVGIVTEEEDDDGEGAVGRAKKNGEKKPELKPEPKKPPMDFDFLKQVREAKTQLKKLFGNDDKYYEVLIRYECTHANEVKPEDQKEVLNDLRKVYKERKAEAEKEDK